jgi:formylglycine-generating enzyme required for sulfatase activity
MTHPVGQKRPNAWGLYDTKGNAWQWCADWCGKGYYAGSPMDDPTGPSVGTRRVVRGGSWFHSAGYCRPAFRNSDAPGDRTSWLGFRVALVPAE